MYHYRLKFRGKDEPEVFIPAHTVDSQGLLQKFMKSEEVMSWDGNVFKLSDIKRVTKEWVVDYKSEEPKPVELTEAQKEQNTRRLRWIRTYIAVYKLAKNPQGRLELGLSKLPDDEKAGYRKFFEWYHSPEQEQRRALKDEFRQETFDTYYPTHDAFDKAFNAWLAKRNQPSLINAAEDIFGVSAT